MIINNQPELPVLRLILCLMAFMMVCMVQPALAYDPVFKHQNLLTRSLARGIYGNDDRKEYFELNDQVQAATRSIPALIFKHKLTRIEDHYIIQANTVGAEYHLCSGEPHYLQPAAAYCSGFIIGNNQIATAGHCVVEDNKTQKPYPVNGGCENIAIVFDYRLNFKGENPLRIPEENVYHCKKVISRRFEENKHSDYAIIEVDRPLQDRPVLKLRSRGDVQIGASITTIGYPLGMPVKAVGGATVRSNDENNYFTTDLDTFHGNSGGPVLDTGSLISGEGIVEGILVRGPEDLQYNFDDECYETKICGVQDALHRKCWGEQVSRIKPLSQHNKMVHTRPAREDLSIKTRLTKVQLYEELKIDLYLPEAGYLTILEINPEGNYTVLFPNKHEQNNRVQAGPFTLTDSPEWKIQVTSGPFGYHQLYAVLSQFPDNLYQQNKSGNGEIFATASVHNLSKLSRGAQAMPRMRANCFDNPKAMDTCNDKPRVASTRVCYYQSSSAECR